MGTYNRKVFLYEISKSQKRSHHSGWFFLLKKLHTLTHSAPFFFLLLFPFIFLCFQSLEPITALIDFNNKQATTFKSTSHLLNSQNIMEVRNWSSVSFCSGFTILYCIVPKANILLNSLLLLYFILNSSTSRKNTCTIVQPSSLKNTCFHVSWMWRFYLNQVEVNRSQQFCF